MTTLHWTSGGRSIRQDRTTGVAVPVNYVLSTETGRVRFGITTARSGDILHVEIGADTYWALPCDSEYEAKRRAEGLHAVELSGGDRLERMLFRDSATRQDKTEEALINLQQTYAGQGVKFENVRVSAVALVAAPHGYSYFDVAYLLVKKPNPYAGGHVVYP